MSLCGDVKTLVEAASTRPLKILPNECLESSRWEFDLKNYVIIGGQPQRRRPSYCEVECFLPPYARRSKSLDTLIPILDLKGVSTGDFAPALAALLGKDGPGLSAATIARLKDVWFDEHKRWSERDLSAKSYVYVWADGVYLQARLEDEAQCILVIIGATPRIGRSCSALSTARARALTTGARCCSISSAGVCRWRPRSPSLMARSASGRRSAKSGLGPVSNDAGCIRPPTFSTSCPRASSPGPSACCNDFPAEHWKHLRTSNPIESTFATVRHRTIRSKGCLSNRTALAMVFKLVEGAQKTWRRLDGHNQLPKIIRGVKFTNGCEVIANPGDLQSQTAAA